MAALPGKASSAHRSQQGQHTAVSGAAGAPPDLACHLEQLEVRALTLERLLAGQVEWAQLETVQHLQLMCAAVDSMAVSSALGWPACIADLCIRCCCTGQAFKSQSRGMHFRRTSPAHDPSLCRSLQRMRARGVQSCS